MLLSTAMGKVMDIFPEATCDEDMDGQIIIYTNMRLDDNGNLISFEEN